MIEDLYLENYQALLACILSYDLTPDSAIRSIVEYRDNDFYKRKRHNKVDKKTSCIKVFDIKEKNEMIFNTAKEVHNFFKNVEYYNRGAVNGAIYKNSVYRRRYKFTRL